MRRSGLTATTITVTLILILSGCGTGTPGPEPTATEPEPATVRDEPAHPTLPVAAAFGKADWGALLDPQSAPLVTPERVLGLRQGQVHAWDPSGSEVWTAPVDSPDSALEGTTLVLRLLSPQIAAVVTTGRTPGKGLAKSGYVASVTLLDVQDGQTLQQIEVAGSGTNPPKLSQYGLAFLRPDATGTAITLDRQVLELPGPLEPQLTDSADTTTAIGTVGDVVITATDTGYAAPTWGTDTLGLVPIPTATRVDATDPINGFAVITQIMDDRGEFTDASALIDVATGHIQAPVECAPWTYTPMTHSPNSQHAVAGPLLLHGSQPTCVGGGEGDKTVELTAITDDGTAYGIATEPGSSQGAILVVVPGDGPEPETLELPDGASAPIGFLDGDIAIHWDPVSGTITGNPRA